MQIDRKYNYNIVVVGVNHKTAPVDIREKIAFQEHIISNSLKKISSFSQITECLILSTCNRVEIYAVGEESPEEIVDAVLQFISEFHNIDKEQFKDYLYIHKNRDAIRHIFRVGASLDSMVVGEPQILGQLKDAYRIATENKTTKIILNKLLHKAFFVAKKVRTETKISNSAVSISFAAVELAKRIFEDLFDKKILLIGAGEMCELAAKHLLTNGANEIFVANRTFERAENLAKEFNGEAIKFEHIYMFLERVDIVISSTGAPHYILNYDKVKDVIKARKYKPIFMIDIAVPRDIDPKINELENIYLYDIDDLKQVVEKNWEARKNEAEKAELIVMQEADVFMEWIESLNVIPVIKKLRENFEQTRQNETEKILKKLNGLDDNQRELIEYLTKAIINKILHAPTVNLKKNRENSYYIEAIKNIFQI
jgi:glutamyl-tRNA reductase